MSAARRNNGGTLSRADGVVGLAFVVLIVALFLPWFSVSIGPVGVSVSGLTRHGYLYIVMVLCILEATYLIASTRNSEIRARSPIPHAPAMLEASVVNLVIVVIAFLETGGAGATRQYGAFVALAAAIVAALSSLLLFRSGS